MKRVLLTLLAVVLLLGALGAAGYAGYRYGYQQGALTTTDGQSSQVTPWGRDFGPGGMPMHNFGFEREFGRGNPHMMGRGGFGFFAPLLFLIQIAFWALVIWALYTLVTRSGWRLTRVQPVVPTSDVQVEEKPEEPKP